MTQLSESGLASTPPSSAAVSQSRGETASGGGDGAPAPCPGRGTEFDVGPGVKWGARGRPYERKPGDPLYRPLRIYTLDPATSVLEGATAVVNVPYEPLTPGLDGCVFRMDRRDGSAQAAPDGTPPELPEANLELPAVLMTSGHAPSPTDPLFHQQMVYAVCSLVYASFRSALGRHVAWGFDPHEGEKPDRTRLTLVPHSGQSAAASYHRSQGALLFGSFEAPDTVTGRTVPKGRIFTCVSHDIVVHELTHALLDGLRAHFLDPTSADVLGFHEGFADVIALLQHFSYSQVVRTAVRASRGALSQAHLLTSLAAQFGNATGCGRHLRSAVDVGPFGEVVPRLYSKDLAPHEMGSVFVSAVFDAFITVYTRKTERYVRLATGGTGMLPEGELSADLQAILAEEATQLAGQFLNVCIRAIDYCPPVDMQLGEFLRAVITADLDLVPDDPWGYREAWIDAFARHRIFPPEVQSLAENELQWKGPENELIVEDLSFSALRFNGDPACPADAADLENQACVLGREVAQQPAAFGVAPPGKHTSEALAMQVTAELPVVNSIRSSRRVGPDGQVVFDLVAEVTQRCVWKDDKGAFELVGGATVILDPRGKVRYSIFKPVLDARRADRQIKFITGPGSGYWMPGPGASIPKPDALTDLHDLLRRNASRAENPRG